MELWQLLLICGLVLAVIILAVWLWYTAYSARQKNAYCRMLAGKKMASMAKSWGHTHLANVRLPFEGKTVRIDHVVVGTFGIVLLNGYDMHGDLYGSRGDKSWYAYTKDNKERKSIPNPMTRMENGIAALRKCFAENGVYNVTDLEALVVFGNDTHLNITLTGKEPVAVLPLKKLGALMHRNKYRLEGKVDVEKAVKALEQAAASVQ